MLLKLLFSYIWKKRRHPHTKARSKQLPPYVAICTHPLCCQLKTSYSRTYQQTDLFEVSKERLWRVVIKSKCDWPGQNNRVTVGKTTGLNVNRASCASGVGSSFGGPKNLAIFACCLHGCLFI